MSEPDDTVDVIDRASWWRATRLTGQRVYRNLRANWKRTLICAAVGWAIGWLANVWVMAKKYDGFRVPSGSAIPQWVCVVPWLT